MKVSLSKTFNEECRNVNVSDLRKKFDPNSRQKFRGRNTEVDPDYYFDQLRPNLRAREACADVYTDELVLHFTQLQASEPRLAQKWIVGNAPVPRGTVSGLISKFENVNTQSAAGVPPQKDANDGESPIEVLEHLTPRLVPGEVSSGNPCKRKWTFVMSEML